VAIGAQCLGGGVEAMGRAEKERIRRERVGGKRNR